jgi:excinuclease ABC subunit C
MHFADQRQLFPLDLRVQCLRGETGSCLAPCAGLCTFNEYAAQLTSARALFDGRDFRLLQKLEAELQHAATTQQYERAVRLRDTLERLQYLCDQLAILRAPPLPERFVYPLQVGDHTAWYLIASCRVVAAAPVPATSESAQRSARLFARALQQNPKNSSDADRPASQIVSSWFRTNPNELQSILSAGDVLDFCRRMALLRA